MGPANSPTAPGIASGTAETAGAPAFRGTAALGEFSPSISAGCGLFTIRDPIHDDYVLRS
jgi:hypothetical protein